MSSASGALIAADSSNGNFVDVHVELWHWGVLLAVIVSMLLLDLLVLHREAKVLSTKRAAMESAAWIACGLAFALVMWWWFGGGAAGEYLSGYLIGRA
jgi:tellurite resistance protein TerC